MSQHPLARQAATLGQQLVDVVRDLGDEDVEAIRAARRRLKVVVIQLAGRSPERQTELNARISAGRFKVGRRLHPEGWRTNCSQHGPDGLDFQAWRSTKTGSVIRLSAPSLDELVALTRLVHLPVERSAAA